LSTDPGQGTVAARGAFRLHRWSDRAVVGAGFGQFGVVAALGDVARGFGQADNGGTLVAQAGLSGTDLGIGLAIMRLASLGALPVIGLADRFGRRTLLLATVGIGLALTVVAAASPTYWWFVAIKPGPVKGGIRLEPPWSWPAEQPVPDASECLPHNISAAQALMMMCPRTKAYQLGMTAKSP
jgi:hypothetical protein